MVVEIHPWAEQREARCSAVHEARWFFEIRFPSYLSDIEWLIIKEPGARQILKAITLDLSAIHPIGILWKRALPSVSFQERSST